MKDRVRELIDINGSSERKKYKEFEELTGIKSGTWKSVCHGVQRVNEDHIKAIEEHWPEYVFWLVTGKTMPEVGQTSPSEAGETVTLREAIISILDAKDMEGVLLTPDQTADLILERLSKQRNVTALEDSKAV
ncbi:hypothetical protein QKW35_13520 [Pontibacterium granulatum]|uniref:hypothetical protein n=1 Tax=Pontibacterium granulatum TaxID=2036029 RepID=UPI00249AB46C|nr:hypothetical protein [Pontibacterium granulatum]MDI3325396.1 hypothetical protein [Pontibacterium granulatum]